MGSACTPVRGLREMSPLPRPSPICKWPGLGHWRSQALSSSTPRSLYSYQVVGLGNGLSLPPSRTDMVTPGHTGQFSRTGLQITSVYDSKILEF